VLVTVIREIESAENYKQKSLKLKKDKKKNKEEAE